MTRYMDMVDHEDLFREIRAACLLTERGEMGTHQLAMHIMCIVKYGPGFESHDLPRVSPPAPRKGWFSRLLRQARGEKP